MLEQDRADLDRADQDRSARNAGIIVGSGITIAGMAIHAAIDGIRALISGKPVASFCDWLVRGTFWICGAAAIGALTHLGLCHRDTRRIQLARGQAWIRANPPPRINVRHVSGSNFQYNIISGRMDLVTTHRREYVHNMPT